MDGMNDMNHVRGGQNLRAALTKWNGGDSTFPRGVFGDTVNGQSFTDEESALLQRFSHSRRSVGAGWWTTWNRLNRWTLIDTRESTDEDVEAYEEAMASM